MDEIYLEVALENADFAETAHFLARLFEVIDADIFIREYCRQELKRNLKRGAIQNSLRNVSVNFLLFSK